METESKQQLNELKKKLAFQNKVGIITLVLVLISVGLIFYFSNNNEDLLDDLLVDNPVSQKVVKDHGKPVKTKEVMPCVDSFKMIMNSHGINEKYPLEPVTISLSQSRLITYSEEFRGSELKRFLRKAARKRKMLINANKNLSVTIALGAYTYKFLYDNYSHDEVEIQRRLGRVAIFFITKELNESGKEVALITGGDDDDSFDLGEINPPPKP